MYTKDDTSQLNLQYGTKLTHTHTRLTALCPGLPGWASTRKVKPIWILLKRDTVSGSGISWAVCKSAPRSRQITMPALHRSVFYRPDALSVAQPTVSKHWRQDRTKVKKWKPEKLESKKRVCSEVSVNSRGIRGVSSQQKKLFTPIMPLFTKQWNW